MSEKADILHTPIKNKGDVIKFFDYLYLDRGVSFHPDDDFADYINLKTKEPSFTKEEATLMNERMKEAFDVLGDEIYSVGMERLEKHYPHMVQRADGGNVEAKPPLQFEGGGNLSEPQSIRRYKSGGAVQLCPVGTEIQTLIFNKQAFTRTQAIAWTKEHDFKKHAVDETDNSWRIRQQEPEKFTKDGFRTITLRSGLKAAIGCPIKKREK